MTEKAFELAGIRKIETVVPEKKKKWYQGKPIVSIAILLLIILGCIFAECIMTKDVLLSTEFDSAYDAMIALNVFLENIDALPTDSRANYQNLRAIGNRIYE